jgi:hypothetical protein
MTRWSIRRRFGIAEDAAPASMPSGWSGAGQSPAGYPPPDQSVAGPAGTGLLTETAAASNAAPPEPLARWKVAAAAAADRLPEPAPPAAANPWPDICDQFGLHMLVLAEQLRASLDELEADEDDPDRLQRLYQVDHAVTRMRRASRDLRILAGRSEEELAGFTTSLLDVIRMAASAIERYTQVSIGRITDLAVLGYAADDVGSLVAALLDNATRYSPGTVTVSGHLLEDGAVMFRVEDTGIGMTDEQITQLNASFVSPAAEVDERTGRHTGFPVVQRIARKHSIGVRLASRPAPATGTVSMITLPPHLLCEVPVDEAHRTQAPPARAPEREPAGRPSAVPDLARRERSGQAAARRAAAAAGDATGPVNGAANGADAAAADGSAELPRRERASLRGDQPRRPAASAPAPALSAEQQAAARRAFAADLSAFAQGSADAADAKGDPRNVGETSTVADTVSQQGPLYQEGTVL